MTRHHSTARLGTNHVASHVALTSALSHSLSTHHLAQFVIMVSLDHFYYPHLVDLILCIRTRMQAC